MAIILKEKLLMHKKANNHCNLHHSAFDQINSQGGTEFTMKRLYVSTTCEPQALKRVENEINLCIRAQPGTR